MRISDWSSDVCSSDLLLIAPKRIMRVRKPAEERKSEIVETALRLADKVGPDRLATGQIAEAVGLTQAALFRHFPKKKDLWQAIAARIGEKFQQSWHAIARGPGAPVGTRRALLTAPHPPGSGA